MRELFEFLNLNVEVKEDPTRNDMLKAIIDFSEKLENNTVDISAVCVMGHGDQANVFGSDEKPVHIKRDILDRFTNENCRSMIEKPK